MKNIEVFFNKIAHKETVEEKFELIFNSSPRNSPPFRNTVYTIWEFLKKHTEENFSEIPFLIIIREAIRNASEHGNLCDTEKKIQLSIWAGQNGFIASVKDEGDFFKNTEIKSCIESKIPLKQEWRKRSNQNYHMGITTIYGSDALFVDTEKNMLYILWLKK